MALISPQPRLQFFDNNGNPLSYGKLYTYAAGTTTPQAAYTDAGGGTPLSNPVILDIRGETSVWLGNLLYKFVLTTSTNASVWTIDNLSAAASQATLMAPDGSTLIGFLQAGTGAVARTLQTKNREILSITDFGATGNGSTNDTAAIQAALAYAGSVRARLFVPNASSFYKITATLVVPDYTSIYGEGYGSCIKQTSREQNVLAVNNYCQVSGLRLQGDGVTSTGIDFTKNNGVSMVNAVNSKVSDCYIHGFEFNGIYLQDFNNVVIENNWIYGNAYSSPSAADVVAYSSTLGARLVVRGNFCLSNNSQGIYVNALGKDTDILVSGNMVATLDSAGVPVASGSLQRRHGIILGYVGGSGSGGRVVCSGNFTYNTRQTGIYWQGTTAPSGTAVIIGNFIRDAGINVLQPGLAAGIFLGCQGRGDIVAHNIIENMPVTGFTIAAGISLLPGNSGATAANSTLIEGNTIIDSAAHGVYVGSNAQNARVVNNSIRGCTESFIAWVPDAAFTGGGYMEFIGNRCSGATKVVQGIYISPTLATGVIGVIDENTINGFNNTTATDTNAGIVIRNFAVNWTVSRNKVNNYYAGAGADVYCNVRCAIQFRDNIFSSCNSGYQLGSSAPVGNVISQNDRLVSTSALQASNVLAGSRCVWPGVYHASTGQFEVRHNAAMTAGIWVVGDRVQQSVSASGSPKGWMCTVAGNPGTWVSEGNL